MNCLLGNKFINSGSIKINSLNPGNQKLKEFLNILPQENVVPEKLKVKELLDFIQKLYKNPLTNEEIDELLRFDDSQKDNFASKLSGGQKRLLSFIITLIGRPKLIFLDEPTAGMDTSTRIRFWEIVNNLKNKGLTIIYSSHYIEEVEHTADRILVLNKGKLIRDTTPHAMRAEEIEKYFTLPIKYLDLLKDSDIINNLLGTFYIDQEKGWTLLNRGTVIGSIHFNIEELIRGLGNKNSDKLLQKSDSINREINQYKQILNISKYQKSIQDEANDNITDFDSTLLNKLEMLRIEYRRLKREKEQIDKLLSDNKNFKTYIESMKLMIRINDKVIPLTSDKIEGYNDTIDSLKSKLRVYEKV